MSLADLILRRWNPLWRLFARLMLSRAKHGSLTGHPRIALRLSRLLPHYSLDGEEFFGSDGAPPNVVSLRERALTRLSAHLRQMSPKSQSATDSLGESLSDLRLMSRYRVPFPFRDRVARELPSPQVVESTDGVRLRDLDGNTFHDLGGSYGVNLLGNEFYKENIEQACAVAAPLGLVLGPYHPVVADNVARLRQVSGLDEVSFHMSGTEAVMQAVRLARYHTGRKHIVRFCGAYHGWWDGVQGGPGNPVPARDLFTLTEMSERTLDVLRMRRDIACVLVNPLQALSPNQGPASDSALVTGRRSARYDKSAYAEWLRQLREVCTERGIVLIFDEVFLGFRLARGGVQEYFGVKADLVTYGKTLGGGLPVGVLCGRRDLMQRYREDKPADICFARGTFAAHPYVMAAMNGFLRALDQPEAGAGWAGIDDRWNDRADKLNGLLAAAAVPVRVANMASVFTVNYLRPGRYLWMMQHYLRAHGLSLSNVGTGRLIFSHDYTDADFDDVAARFVAAASEARDDGWLWCPEEEPQRSLTGKVRTEMIAAFFGYARPRLPGRDETPSTPALTARAGEAAQ